MKAEMQVIEMVLPMIVLIAPDIKGTEYERTLFELNKAVSLISNDRVLVDLMIVEKIPAFFDAISFHEDFNAKYSTVIKEIADFALWKMAKRKHEYRKYGVSYLRPVIVLISDFTNQDELVYINSPEWLEQINNRSFCFNPYCIDEKHLNAESNSNQSDIEVLRAERLFEEYCINVRDYDPIDIEEQCLPEQPSTLTIEIDI